MPWLVVKGDPSIRGLVFEQCRAESALDALPGPASRTN